MANEENREKIVETALQMFNTRGCRGVTMDDIAQAMHMSKRTLYETFANKEELLAECLMRVHDQINDLHRKAHSKVDEPLLVAMYMLPLPSLSIIPHKPSLITFMKSPHSRPQSYPAGTLIPCIIKEPST